MIRAEANAEEQLLSFVKQLKSAKMGWQALHLHLSKLSPFTRKDYNLRIAHNALDDVTKKFKGRLFLLGNLDVVLLVKGALVSEVNEAIFKVKFLFQDDPLTKTEDGLSTWYDLSISYDSAVNAFTEVLSQKIREQEDSRGSGLVTEEEIEPLDAGRLHKLQSVLSSLDISTYLRRQSVCILSRDRETKPVFDELYVRIADLQRPLMPNVDFLGNRWLFQNFTEILDARVLVTLTRSPKKFLDTPTSINLNVDTILSQRFIDFDAAIRDGAQKSIVLELQVFDVMADVGAFRFARDFTRNKGYRLCMDGLTALSFDVIDHKQLGFDLLKVFWDDAMVNMARQNRAATLSDAIKKVGAQRVVLAHCDDEAAIDFGQSAGVLMFQGRYVDYLHDPKVRSRN